jgi:TM2 domain-containing membrane protein YozV/ribosomal protein L40E
MTDAVQKAADEKFCADCGAVIKARAEICPKCGIRQLPPPGSLAAVAPNGKSKLVAGLFGMFLGGIGVHKFYLGRIGWGIAYLLFFWTFIPAVVGFIEGILLLAMSNEEFNVKYGNAYPAGREGPPRSCASRSPARLRRSVGPSPSTLAPMTITPQLFRKVLLLSVAVALLQWLLSDVFPKSIPEALRIADEKTMDEIGNGFARFLTKEISPGLAILTTLTIGLSILAGLGALALSYVGLYLFKWWARPLSAAVMLGVFLLPATAGYVLLSGPEFACANVQAGLWSAIVSMAYFSPISQRFSRHER